MELKTFFAQDTQGNILPTPTAYLYLPGTTTLASGLQDASGSPLSNPFTGDANGRIQLAAPDGDYDLRVVKAKRDYTMRVRFIDVAEQLAEAQGIVDDLKTVWYGDLPADPEVDPLGNPPKAGASYYNTTLKQTRIFDGAEWGAQIDPTDASAVAFQQAGSDAVARTVQDKLREFVSVKDFGAKGDGVSDDTAAIQAALDYALANKKALYVPSGSYVVTATLTVAGSATGALFTYSNCRIFGDGANNTQIVSAVSGPALWIKTGHCEIGQMTFRSTGGTNPVGVRWGDEAAGTAVSQSSMFDVKFLYYFKGLELSAVWDCSFYRVGVFSGATGGFGVDVLPFTADNSNNLDFYNCHFERIPSGTLFRAVSAKNTVNNRHHRWLFSGCHFETSFYNCRALHLDGIFYSQFVNCNFINNENYGGAESGRVSQIYLKDSNQINFVGGFVSTEATSSTAAKLIQTVGETAGVCFDRVWFRDVANVPGGNIVDGLIDATSAADSDYSGVIFRQCSINDVRNVALSVNDSVIGSTNARFKQDVGANFRLMTYFGNFTSDIAGSWSAYPVSVMGQHGSMSRGVPVNIPNGGSADFAIENAVLANGPAIIAVMANTPGATAGLFFKRGTTVYPLAALSAFVVSDTPSAGQFGISAPADNLIRIHNNYGTASNVSLFVMGAQ